jgi:hypothetical protein
LFLRHQTMDKVQKYNSFNTNTPSSESYRNYLENHILQFLYSCWHCVDTKRRRVKQIHIKFWSQKSFLEDNKKELEKPRQTGGYNYNGSCTMEWCVCLSACIHHGCEEPSNSTYLHTHTHTHTHTYIYTKTMGSLLYVYIYKITNQLTPQRRVLGKLITIQVVKKSPPPPAFMEIEELSPCSLVPLLSQIHPVYNVPPYIRNIILLLSYHQCVVLPSSLLLSGVSTKILYAFWIATTNQVCKQKTSCTYIRETPIIIIIIIIII